MNPFEAGTRKVIPAVLIYARCDDRVLMVHRNASEADYHQGKWNGLGGKLEADESPLECARREFFEESGLDLPLERFKAMGTLQFPNFKPHKNEDWWVTVFLVKCDNVSLPSPVCSEGELRWIAVAELLTLNLWAGDRHFLPHIIDERPFIGTFWYEKQRVVRSWMQVLESDGKLKE